MKQIKFAILGYGAIAKTHANAAYNSSLYLNLNQDLVLKYVYTRTLRKVPPNTLNTTDLKVILEDNEISFVDICTTNESHIDYIKQSISSKKSIYCEKPLTSNLDDSKLATKLVNESKTQNAVALVYRFAPGIQLLKQIIENNSKIGRIIRFKVNMYHKSYLDPSRKGKWRTTTASGGGAHLDLGVHVIDMIQYVFGPIESVRAKSSVFFEDRTEVDEITECHFNLSNEVKGDIEVSRIYGEQDQGTEFTVFGEFGSYKFDSRQMFLLKYYDFTRDESILLNCKNYPETIKYIVNTGGFTDLHMATMAAFSDEISTGVINPNIARFDHSLSAEKVVYASYESSRLNKRIKIN